MGFKAKLFEVMLYPDSYDLDMLPVVLETIPGIRDYAYCVHDQDGKKAHCHVMLRMSDTRDSYNVAKWFQANSSQVEKCKGRWADMLAYLTHMNAPDKFQYDPKLVKSNFEWQAEAAKAGKRQNRNKRKAEIINGIALGEIREFNVHEHVTVEEFVEFEAAMNKAFKYRVISMKGADRNMRSIYVYGDSGTGKTTWAKQFAESKGYSVFISSGSNDVLDDYKGQDCIVLDDLRPSCMGLSDLLKMLDPRTASTVKSRYYNKVLECKAIIITTTLPMENFFHQVFENEAEPLRQLERRCGVVIRLTKNKIFMRMYDPKHGRYIHSDPVPNTVLASLNLESLTEDDVLEMEAELLMTTKANIKKLREADTPNSRKAADMVQAELNKFGAHVSDPDKVPF